MTDAVATASATLKASQGFSRSKGDRLGSREKVRKAHSSFKATCQHGLHGLLGDRVDLRPFMQSPRSGEVAVPLGLAQLHPSPRLRTTSSAVN